MADAAKKADLKAVPDAPAPVDLASDGRVTVRLDAGEWTLRRPKFGEFARLKERADVLNTDEDLRADELAWFKARFDWWREVFEMLSPDGPEFPDIDDLPLWFGGQEMVMQVVAHWIQSPPVAPGG